MLCNSETDRSFQTSQVLYLTLLIFYLSVQLSITSTVPNTYYNTTDTMLATNITNNSVGDDLYVIKAVVYEIGILTDADNTTNDTTERQEEVKLSFYNPPNNSKGP
ncbi:hypothetical protein WH47_05097 [Habropoda laboriosa]|uniref:Uncharacterized protein n=1 Tax=Habropoda laboriosa TaxID=597456 RepID=A0A0L7QS82_9HYME|nr:PREDICTED: uncharacterized protein LOC108575772 [Habropoda laboriosa]KOC61493.1 hypothetical protein WH47_05097 [Habropoda laboriosa]